MEKPVRSEIIVATSLMDLVIISALVVLWPVRGGQTRLDNELFLFYYPVILGFALVMPRRMEILYTATAIATYAIIILLMVDMNVRPDHPEYSDFTALQVNLKILLFRLIVMAAVGGLANYFWRIQRERRREAVLDTVKV